MRLPDSAPALPFLRPDGDRLVVADGIRARVGFRRLNLASEDYPADGLADLDLVLCRNVFIYLDKAMLPAIVGRLFASLAEGGWLLTAAPIRRSTSWRRSRWSLRRKGSSTVAPHRLVGPCRLGFASWTAARSGAWRPAAGLRWRGRGGPR